jgi:hypothetical protein
MLFGTVLAATLVSGCKQVEETAPDAGAVLVPTAPVDPALAVDAAAAPVIPPPLTPTPVSPTPVTTPKSDAGVATDAGTPADAGAATDAGAKPDAGGTVTLSNCRANCLAQLATCMTPQPGKNGGAPVFADANKCRAASDSCQAACK